MKYDDAETRTNFYLQLKYLYHTWNTFLYIDTPLGYH